MSKKYANIWEPERLVKIKIGDGVTYLWIDKKNKSCQIITDKYWKNNINGFENMPALKKQENIKSLLKKSKASTIKVVLDKCTAFTADGKKHKVINANQGEELFNNLLKCRHMLQNDKAGAILMLTFLSNQVMSSVRKYFNDYTAGLEISKAPMAMPTLKIFADLFNPFEFFECKEYRAFQANVLEPGKIINPYKHEIVRTISRNILDYSWVYIENKAEIQLEMPIYNKSVVLTPGFSPNFLADINEISPCAGFIYCGYSKRQLPHDDFISIDGLLLSETDNELVENLTKQALKLGRFVKTFVDELNSRDNEWELLAQEVNKKLRRTNGKYCSYDSDSQKKQLIIMREVYAIFLNWACDNGYCTEECKTWELQSVDTILFQPQEEPKQETVIKKIGKMQDCDIFMTFSIAYIQRHIENIAGINKKWQPGIKGLIRRDESGSMVIIPEDELISEYTWWLETNGYDTSFIDDNKGKAQLELLRIFKDGGIYKHSANEIRYRYRYYPENVEKEQEYVVALYLNSLVEFAKKNNLDLDKRLLAFADTEHGSTQSEQK